MRYIRKARLIVTIMSLIILLLDCKKEIKLSSENAIKTFILKRANNAGLPEDITFTIDEQKLEITGTILQWIDSETPSKLITDFETTGKSVTIKGVNQLNGFTINDFKEPLNYTVKA
ncbi:MAG TPA: hypothetical protein VGK38_07925, partial [Prolixibacteraceae bacterium]